MKDKIVVFISNVMLDIAIDACIDKNDNTKHITKCLLLLVKILNFTLSYASKYIFLVGLKSMYGRSIVPE